MVQTLSQTKCLLILPLYITARVVIHIGPYATARMKYVSLFDGGGPQTFVCERTSEHMKRIGPASAVCETTTQPRGRGGFGDSITPLTKQKPMGLSVHFFHDTTRSASLAIWKLCLRQHHASRHTTGHRWLCAV